MTGVIRQGDVLLVPTMRRKLPQGKACEVRDGRLILAYGEATGHHHSVSVMDAEMVEAAAGVFLRIMRATPLEHQEHMAHVLEPGVYEVRRQVEYAPKALPRRVAD